MKICNYKTIKKTKKEHECFWCHKKIEPGSFAYYEFVFSGYIKKANFSCYYHKKCWEEITKDYRYELANINDSIIYEMLHIKEIERTFEGKKIPIKDGWAEELRDAKKSIEYSEKDKQNFWKNKG